MAVAVVTGGMYSSATEHSRRCHYAVVLAEALHGTLTAEPYNLTVWLDVKMDDKSVTAMEHGVRNSRAFLAVVTGPCVNPDRPDDDPATNAYFRRPYCLKELRWAVDAGKRIQPIIRAEDKSNIGTLLADAPGDLKFLGGIDFIDLERNDREYWDVGVRKIQRFFSKSSGTKAKALAANQAAAAAAEARTQVEADLKRDA